jgi:tetratricopeptide (TPR) repeat protein
MVIRQRVRQFAAAALVVAALAPAARADKRSEALDHFKRANTEFDLGHYKIAAREFEQAYKLQQQYLNPPEHTLLFNIGQAYRLGGDYPDALIAYRAFIQREPGSPERGHVAKLIANLERLKSAESAAQARPRGTIPPGGSRASDSPTSEAADNDFGKRMLVLATEQNGPNQMRGWTDVVWGPGGGSRSTTVVRNVTEIGGIEATLSDELGNAGFDIIDPSVLRGRLMPRAAVEAVNLGAADARSVALRSDADVVVIVKGVAQASTQPTLGSMYSGQANLTARAVRVSDGKVLAAATQHAAQVHIDADTARQNALIEGARMIARTLAQKLTSY